ncbi:MAG TPA: GAF domain-containing sensor histidine kinase [Longimicrobiales bacterium]|nr:GAF domain-containing sensor histidine kinase [Longimicrobiales bacterium]
MILLVAALALVALWLVFRARELGGEVRHLHESLQAQTEMAEQAARRAERLHDLTSQLVAIPAEEPVLNAVARQARLATGALAAAVVAPRSDGRPGLVASDGMASTLARAAEAASDSPTPAGDVMQTGEPVWIETRKSLAERYPEAAELADPEGRAWAALPLLGNSRLLGAIVLSFGRPGGFRAEDRSFMLLLAQQCAQAVERAQLNERGMRARVRAEFAERRLAFLAEASQRLASSLDYQTSLSAMAEMAVPDLADWCLVYLADEAGMPHLVALAHPDPVRREGRREFEARYPGSGLAADALRRVMATGEPDLILDVTDDMLRAAARDEEHHELLRSFRLRSVLSVPIAAEDRVIGSLTLALAHPGREFGEPDVTLAMELGRRAGQAVENARLYTAAHHASAAKSDFLAVMSHELRTPLNAIIGYADLLLMGVPDDVGEGARRQVQRIRGASDSLLQLVEEVLSFSRIEAGKEEIRISPVDLSELLRDTVAMVEPLAAEKSLELRLELPDRRLRLVSDERKIRQIVTNLLSNAVKFTQQGTIEVSATSDESGFRVDVRDTGIGIPVEYLERIFEPFWQVENVSTRRYGGTGLGLGVARKLARMLEGRLDVSSEEGQGSVFSLILPRHTPGMNRNT